MARPRCAGLAVGGVGDHARDDLRVEAFLKACGAKVLEAVGSGRAARTEEFEVDVVVQVNPPVVCVSST